MILILNMYQKQERYKGEDFALFWDNIYAQRIKVVIDAIRGVRGHCIWGPRGKTHGWQPIDRGQTLGVSLGCYYVSNIFFLKKMINNN